MKIVQQVHLNIFITILERCYKDIFGDNGANPYLEILIFAMRGEKFQDMVSSEPTKATVLLTGHLSIVDLGQDF